MILASPALIDRWIPPDRLELSHLAPEANALSTELWGLRNHILPRKLYGCNWGQAPELGTKFLYTERVSPLITQDRMLLFFVCQLGCYLIEPVGIGKPA